MNILSIKGSLGLLCFSSSNSLTLKKSRKWLSKSGSPVFHSEKPFSISTPYESIYFSSSAIDSVKISSSGMNSDIHASSDYRANMVKAFAKKAVDAC